MTRLLAVCSSLEIRGRRYKARHLRRECVTERGSVTVFRVIVVKIENRSRKLSHKPTESESEESERFHFFRFRLRLRRLCSSENWVVGVGSRSGRTNQSQGVEHCHWFILPLLLATPTMQFSLDRKRRSRKQNQCSASDFVILYASDFDSDSDSVASESQP